MAQGPTTFGNFSEFPHRELWLHANSLNDVLPPSFLFIFVFMCCLSWTPKEMEICGKKERARPEIPSPVTY